MNKNFRVTTDYILQIINATNQLFYSIWASGVDGDTKIEISSEADVNSEEIDWDYEIFQLPDPPVSINTNNYRKTSNNVLQLYNIDTMKWNTIFITGDRNNPILNISQKGEL